MIFSLLSSDNRQRYKDFGSRIWDLGFNCISDIEFYLNLDLPDERIKGFPFFWVKSS